jgi:hypothetical protein
VFIGAPPVQGVQARFDLPHDDSPAPELRPQGALAAGRGDARKAVVEGLAEAQARGRGRRPPSAPGRGDAAARRAPLRTFKEEETRQVDADMLAELRQVRGEAAASAAAPAATSFDENEATVMSDPDELRRKLPSAKRPPAGGAARSDERSIADVDWDLD